MIVRRVPNWFRLAGLVLTGLLVGSCMPLPQSALSPRGPAAARIAGLWWVMFGVAAIVLVVVTVLLLMALNRSSHAGQAPRWVGDGRRFVLIGGAIVPAVILSAVMGLAIFALRTLAAPPSRAGLTIEVIGHQWWWEVRYPDQGFTTANEIHIPVGQPVTVRVSTADVIHSVWVPVIQAKIDAIPGLVNSTWFQASEAGVYRGQCAEYCGTQHALMAFEVVAENPADFDTWLSGQRQPAAPATSPQLERGQQLFTGGACAGCHAVRGTSAQARVGPDLTHFASRRTLAAATRPNNRENLDAWILNSQTIKPGNHMPPTPLAPDDLAALVDYLQSLK